MIEVYHNPRCGKSRNCLAFLENTNQEYKIIKYLEETPDAEQIKDLLKKLHLKPVELVRQKEKVWIENFKNIKMTDKAIIQAMIDYPILIERPIIIRGNEAIIARETDKIDAFFKDSSLL
ncbi:arsenate reductase (glutaredoxin) [Flavobacterium sp. ARAG 55.4]|uniref:arsenate reductase (glutaredoxin) n=1 Tax=Flavobacterium sp. ARAG 55.4 TaxID=3451357 RepID=UPI003F48652F